MSIPQSKHNYRDIRLNQNFNFTSNMRLCSAVLWIYYDLRLCHTFFLKELKFYIVIKFPDLFIGMILLYCTGNKTIFLNFRVMFKRISVVIWHTKINIQPHGILYNVFRCNDRCVAHNMQITGVFLLAKLVLLFYININETRLQQTL